ncbi:hypothetical protein KR009_011992, partial [Drosophila setifemur]
MSEDPLCKLCLENRAIEIDLEKAKFKLANKLLQRLFEWYSIDISILSDSSCCICESCFADILQLSQTLEKWGKARENLQEKPLDIDDSKAFQVKLEAPSSEDEKMVVEPPLELVSGIQEEVEEKAWKPSPNDFFCAGLGRDGLVLTHLVRDKTKATKMVCTCCDGVFDILAHIRAHSALTRSNPLYMCRQCGKTFTSTQDLKEHVDQATDHPIASSILRELEFRCLRCGQLLRFFDAIRHENSVHSALEFVCMECNMHFKFKGSYTKHLREHEGQPKRVRSKAKKSAGVTQEEYHCDIPHCNRKFRVFTRFAKHQKWH